MKMLMALLVTAMAAIALPAMGQYSDAQRIAYQQQQYAADQAAIAQRVAFQAAQTARDWASINNSGGGCAQQYVAPCVGGGGFARSGCSTVQVFANGGCAPGVQAYGQFGGRNGGVAIAVQSGGGRHYSAPRIAVALSLSRR